MDNLNLVLDFIGVFMGGFLAYCVGLYFSKKKIQGMVDESIITSLSQTEKDIHSQGVVIGQLTKITNILLSKELLVLEGFDSDGTPVFTKDVEDSFSEHKNLERRVFFGRHNNGMPDYRKMYIIKERVEQT